MNHDTPPAATTAARLPLGVRLPWEFAFSLGWLSLGLLVLAAATLAWRRWAGALADPPAALPLLTVGIVTAAAAASARLLHSLPSSGLLHPVTTWIPSVALGLLGWAMTSRGGSMVAIGGFWAILVVEEIGTLLLRVRRATDNRPKKLAGMVPVFAASPTETPKTGFSPSKSAWAEPQCGEGHLPTPSAADHVVQQFVRTQASDGTEGISGWLRISVAARQRTVSAHVAFCPPLGRVPSWDLRQTEGPKARLRTTQLMTYGARIEAKLDASPAEPAELLVRFNGCTDIGEIK